MSQIDKLNFLPNLFWFLVLFIVFYFLIFSYILPLIFQSLQLRSIFFASLLEENFSFNIFYFFIVHFYNINYFDNILKKLFIYFAYSTRIINLYNFWVYKTFWLS